MILELWLMMSPVIFDMNHDCEKEECYGELFDSIEHFQLDEWVWNK